MTYGGGTNPSTGFITTTGAINISGGGSSLLEQVEEHIAEITEKLKSMEQRQLSMIDFDRIQRLVALSGQVLPLMRDAGLHETEYALFTALRDVLLSIHESGIVDVEAVGRAELRQDLIDLAADLEPPTPS